MGQAKRRGSFEERKAAAITENEARRVRILKERTEREAAKTPEDRRAERAVALAYARLFGMMTSLSGQQGLRVIR